MKPGGKGLNDSAVATALDPPLVDVRAPVGPGRGCCGLQSGLAADVPHGHRLEGLDYASGGDAARISTGQQADKQCLVSSR
jgi:hypothetical protein